MKRHDVIKLVEWFVAIYPESEYRFAHIVLSDYNLDDSDIDFCLGEVEKNETSNQQTKDTVAFLQYLKTIPESAREDDRD